MSFIGIEFTDDSGGGLALVSKQWLTPRKQVFWPPYKFQSQYNKAIKKGVVPEEDGSWKIFKIKRCFFETDDYSKAQRQIKQAQVTSDCQSEVEEVLPLKRTIHKPKKLIYSSSDDEDEVLSEKHKLPPPPKIVRLNNKANNDEASSSSSRDISISYEMSKSIQQSATSDTLNSFNGDPQTSYSPSHSTNIFRSSSNEQSATSDTLNSFNGDPQTSYSSPSHSTNIFRSFSNNTPTTSTVIENSFQNSIHNHDTVTKKIFSFLIHIKEQNNKI